MAMSDDEKLEFTDTLKNLSADELRGMLGDDDEQDALINGILGGGKQVEVKGKDDEQEEDPHPNPEDKRVEPEKKPEGEEEEEEEDPPAAAAPTEAAAPAPSEAPTEAPAAAPAVEIPTLNLSFLDTDYDQKLDALDTEKAEKFKELMDGTLDPAEYAKFESGYLAKREALRDDKTAAAGWLTNVHDFRVQALKNEGVNYFDPKFNDALDDWVIRLSSKGVPDSEVLQQAHKKVLAEFDITPTKAGAAPAPTAAPAAAPAKPANKNRAPDLSGIPPSLGGLPAAAGADPKNEGEFAHIDGLEGEAYERALARMTPDQQARYLAGQ